MKTSLRNRLKITLAIKAAIRSPYAWPGGYQLAIVMNDGAAICPDCARKEWKQIVHDTLKGWSTGWDAALVSVLWEGENHCANCNFNLTVY